MKDVTVGYVLEKIASILSKREFQIKFTNYSIQYWLFDKNICDITDHNGENALSFNVNREIQEKFMSFKKLKVLIKLLSKLDQEIVNNVQSNIGLIRVPSTIKKDSLFYRRDFKQYLIENGLSEFKQFKEFCNNKFD